MRDNKIDLTHILKEIKKEKRGYDELVHNKERSLEKYIELMKEREKELEEKIKFIFNDSKYLMDFVFKKIIKKVKKKFLKNSRRKIKNSRKEMKNIRKKKKIFRCFKNNEIPLYNLINHIN